MSERPRQLGEKTPVIILAAALVILFAAACSANDGGGPGSSTDLPQGAEPVDLDPKDFTTRIDHPYWPMDPGVRWTYRETARKVRNWMSSSP